MNKNTSIVVGFIESYKYKTQAEGSLKSIPGFIRMLHTYEVTSAVLVEVDSKQLNQFILGAKNLIDVEYCSK